MMRFLRARLKSFTFAFKGIIFVLRHEANARLHLVFAFCILHLRCGVDI